MTYMYGMRSGNVADDGYVVVAGVAEDGAIVCEWVKPNGTEPVHTETRFKRFLNPTWTSDGIFTSEGLVQKEVNRPK